MRTFSAAASRNRCFLRAWGASALCLLWLGGCAPLPGWPDKESLALSVPHTLSAGSAAARMAWPQDHWWRRYGSEQLNGLIDEALQGAPDMALAAARVRHAQALLGVRISARAPQLSAQASITTYKRSVNGDFNGDFNGGSPGAMALQAANDASRLALQLDWSLDLWGKYRAAIAAAEGELQARQADAAQTRLLLASSVAAAYAHLVRLSRTEHTLAQSVQMRETTARLFAERFANGLETQGGVQSAQARWAAARAELAQVQEQVALQRNHLAVLVGAPPDRGAGIVVSADSLQPPWQQHWALPEHLPANLLGRRPDVVAARLQAQALSARVAVKQAQFYPDVNLAAFIGVQPLHLSRLLQGDLNMGQVGPAISLPIFNAGRLQAELGAARAGYAEAVALYQQTLNQALREVADNAVRQRALQRQLAARQQAVDAAAQAQRVARDRYEGGLASYLEVLTAEDQWLGNVRQLVEVQADALSLDIDLHRALGGGWQAPADTQVAVACADSRSSADFSSLTCEGRHD